MTLKEWVVSRGGISATARELKVHHTTVVAWLQGRTTPNSPLIKRIHALSKKKVSYETLLTPVNSYALKGKRHA